MCTSKYSLQILAANDVYPFCFIEMQRLERNNASQLHFFTRGKRLLKKRENTYRRPSKVKCPFSLFLFFKKKQLYIVHVNKQMTLKKKRDISIPFFVVLNTCIQ